MEYGKLQGEVAAAAHVSVGGEIPFATIIGNPFNVESVQLTGVGTFTVTLHDGVDPLDCSIVVTAHSSPLRAMAVSALDTDTVKNVTVVNAGGVATTGGFYIVVERTNVGSFFA